MKKKLTKNSHVRKSKPKIVVKKTHSKPLILTVVTVKKERKPRVKSLDKMYFTQDTEDAIVEYTKETDEVKRNQIYNSRIKYPFEKLVENIFNTFKFSYFETGPQDAQKETVSHLAMNMEKYDQTTGFKAFSYFSVMAKNYLIAENNKNHIRFGRHETIGEEREEHTIQLQCEDLHHKNAEMEEFMRLMIEFWDNNVTKIFNKKRDLDIANAVIELFRQSGRLEAFNKKALYLNIRDISNCKTQQITKVINKMKQYQANITKSYLLNGAINTESYIKV